MQPVMELPYTSDCWACDTTSDGADLQADAIIDGAALRPDANSEANLQPALQPDTTSDGASLQPDATIDEAALQPRM